MAGTLDEMLAQGAARFDQLVRDEQEEGLYLEFKTLTDRAANTLDRKDKQIIARAVCGLSNAEGGLVIFGVETEKVDGLDVAKTLRPVGDVQALRNRVAGAIPEMLNPANKIFVHAIEGDAGRGFLVIEVPASDVRPHMSIPHHQYFRRRNDSTFPMEHGEVRDQMLAAREAVLDLIIYAQPTMNSGLGVSFELIVGLQNVGRAAAVAPYVRLSGTTNSFTPIGDANDKPARRRSADGTIGFYSATSRLLHVDDDLAICSTLSGIRFKGPQTLSLSAAASRVRALPDPSDFFINSNALNPNANWDERVRFTASWGAQNGFSQERSWDLSKLDMFDLIETKIH